MRPAQEYSRESMKNIKKIKLQNFKRFQDFSVNCDDTLNTIIGDNEAGKSTILLALDLVLSGSRSKIETIGLESIFNVDVINHFLSSDKRIENLPVLYIELYLNEQDNLDLNGRINSENTTCDGLRLICEPNDQLSPEIKDILQQQESNFPFEYYSINFVTFSGEIYTGYRKFLRHVFIDNTQISNEYATRAYVKAIYSSSINDGERNKHQNEYRKYKKVFKDDVLSGLNSRLNNYEFTIRTGLQANLETDLTISENNINIENRGKGRQCFIKTEFALKKNNNNKEFDVILLEEPENHLSHINMKKLIQKISSSQERQIFIATHNNMISTRLDLRKSILLNSNSLQPVLLQSISEPTAKYFMKAPNNNILEFILSKNVILVEGDAEFILMDLFFQKATGNKLEDYDLHVISVGGTSFKRFLEIAALLDIRTAVIRDNDGDYENHCVNNYLEYVKPNIQIFYDDDNSRRTFEIALYQDNTGICEELFAPNRRKLCVQDFMLQNKADVAFEILDKKNNEVVIPSYIRNAIEWIIS